MLTFSRCNVKLFQYGIFFVVLHQGFYLIMPSTLHLKKEILQFDPPRDIIFVLDTTDYY